MSVREKCDEKRGEGSPSVSVIDLPGPLLEKREKWGTRKERKDGATSVVVARANIVQRVGQPPMWATSQKARR